MYMPASSIMISAVSRVRLYGLTHILHQLECDRQKQRKVGTHTESGERLKKIPNARSLLGIAESTAVKARIAETELGTVT